VPRHCREHTAGRAPDPADDGLPGFDPAADREVEDPTRPPNIWEMMPWVEAAAGAAYAGAPVLIVWDFEKE